MNLRALMSMVALLSPEEIRALDLELAIAGTHEPGQTSPARPKPTAAPVTKPGMPGKFKRRSRR